MSDNCRYRYQFRPYQRQFRQPLRTSHGLWQIREGIIVSLIDSKNRVGRGEIAPLPWFGSETTAEALQFCSQWDEEISTAAIFDIPDSLPACQFGFETALNELTAKKEQSSHNIDNSLQYSYLLPAGEAVLTTDTILKQNQSNSNFCFPTTFKWKIGVEEIAKELSWLKQITKILPAGALIRLDANGGLTVAEAQTWLEVADEANQIEFIEQPLPPQQFSQMLALSCNYATPIALDESVANLKQLIECYQQGWRGIFVIKPAIAGFPHRLRQFCQQHSIDGVFSSVFETQIGRQAVLKLATELSNPKRAVGFGVNHWFEAE